MEVKHKDIGQKGSFYIELKGDKVAEMTYSLAKPNTIIIDHTEVSESLKGQGVGYKLVEEAVKYMRLKKLKVIPLCPFANAVFKKKRNDYADVLK
ncbi:MAG: N-acetyltransferase [Flaviramulus sp.]|nr:GNAT family N-acetyltransferase [Flaviramulus sp.]NNC49515.1 N-acetyltransferase [Flaviramulus sp.]